MSYLSPTVSINFSIVSRRQIHREWELLMACFGYLREI